MTVWTKLTLCLFLGPYYEYNICIPLRWRHNECVGVSCRQLHDYLLNRLFRRKKVIIWWRHHDMEVWFVNNHHWKPLSLSGMYCYSLTNAQIKYSFVFTQAVKLPWSGFNANVLCKWCWQLFRIIKQSYRHCQCSTAGDCAWFALPFIILINTFVLHHLKPYVT